MTLTFFTIVTPTDLPIAYHCIRALSEATPTIEHPVSIVIFFNGVAPPQQKRIRNLRFHCKAEFRDNYDLISANADEIRRQIGHEYTDSGGIRAAREGAYENGSVIWSRELLQTPSEFVAIIDADFEILDPRFINEMIAVLMSQQHLGFFSTDYSPTRQTFDTYSDEECTIYERYHTWFCIYRQEALRLESDFSFHERRSDTGVVKFDHGANLQKRLKELHHLAGAHLPAMNQWMFLHYGAFAKNRMLFGTRLRLYRFVRILCHNGYLHRHRVGLAAVALRLLGRILNRALCLNRYDRERRKFIFSSAP